MGSISHGTSTSGNSEVDTCIDAYSAKYCKVCILREGFVYKKTKGTSEWKKRWMVLQSDARLIVCTLDPQALYVLIKKRGNNIKYRIESPRKGLIFYRV